MLQLLQTQQRFLEPLQLCRVIFFTSFPPTGLSLIPRLLTGTKPQPLAGFRYETGRPHADPRTAEQLLPFPREQGQPGTATACCSAPASLAYQGLPNRSQLPPMKHIAMAGPGREG